jgi:hypothetical protein
LFVHYNLKIKVEHFCVFFDRNNVNSQWVTAGKTLGAMLYIWKTMFYDWNDVSSDVLASK